MEAMQKVFKMFGELTEGLSKEDTEQVYFNMAAVGLGIIHGEHGEQFYLEFIEGAVKNPLPIKITENKKH